MATWSSKVIYHCIKERGSEWPSRKNISTRPSPAPMLALNTSEDPLLRCKASLGCKMMKSNKNDINCRCRKYKEAGQEKRLGKKKSGGHFDHDYASSSSSSSQSVKRSRSDEQIVAGKQNQVIGVLIVVVIEKMKRTNSSSGKWLQSIPTFYIHTLRLGKSRAEEKGTNVGQSRPNTDGRASTELSTKELKNAPTFPPDTGYGHERSSFRKRGTFPQAIVDYITAQNNNTIQYNIPFSLYEFQVTLLHRW
ncbi:hypothetical protein T07_1951 [Trichinella nelsoni]|uniref:Uncharacterized protein n=1 Tax=Trichinella nelsoni TaxID=6336 RepID=A0A0V0SF49_9BILA|nr:hypothetical protein T07_1951 [Trichinella nelsoni]